MKKNSLKLRALFLLMSSISSYTYAGAVEDTAITAAVKAALILEKDIPSQKIEVTTNDNIVNLKGTVDTRLQADKAVEIASSMDNVVDVIDDNLKVTDSSSVVADSMITAKAKGKIRHLSVHNKIAPNYELHVETTNKIVHIFGEVAKSADIDLIKSEVGKIKNVDVVRTNIRVKK